MDHDGLWVIPCAPLNDILLEIGKSLDLPDLFRCGLVCRTWRSILSTNVVWESKISTVIDEVTEGIVNTEHISPEFHTIRTLYIHCKVFKKYRRLEARLKSMIEKIPCSSLDDKCKKLFGGMSFGDLLAKAKTFLKHPNRDRMSGTARDLCDAIKIVLRAHNPDCILDPTMLLVLGECDKTTLFGTSVHEPVRFGSCIDILHQRLALVTGLFEKEQTILMSAIELGKKLDECDDWLDKMEEKMRQEGIEIVYFPGNGLFSYPSPSNL